MKLQTSKRIKILLRSEQRIIAVVIAALGIHIIYKTYGKQIQVSYRYAKLYASQKE